MFASTFTPESQKFILQLNLDQKAVKEMLRSLPYAHLRSVSLPLELRGKASYYAEMVEIARHQSCPHYGRYTYPSNTSNECNIEISACVRLENPEEFYEANGLSLTQGTEKIVLIAIKQLSTKMRHANVMEVCSTELLNWKHR